MALRLGFTPFFPPFHALIGRRPKIEHSDWVMPKAACLNEANGSVRAEKLDPRVGGLPEVLRRKGANPPGSGMVPSSLEVQPSRGREGSDGVTLANRGPRFPWVVFPGFLFRWWVSSLLPFGEGN